MESDAFPVAGQRTYASATNIHTTPGGGGRSGRTPESDRFARSTCSRAGWQLGRFLVWTALAGERSQEAHIEGVVQSGAILMAGDAPKRKVHLELGRKNTLELIPTLVVNPSTRFGQFKGNFRRTAPPALAGMPFTRGNDHVKTKTESFVERDVYGRGFARRLGQVGINKSMRPTRRSQLLLLLADARRFQVCASSSALAAGDRWPPSFHSSDMTIKLKSKIR